jgi:hypothetical protein
VSLKRGAGGDYVISRSMSDIERPLLLLLVEIGFKIVDATRRSATSCTLPAISSP